MSKRFSGTKREIAHNLYEYYTKRYADNPNLVKALSEEKIRACLDVLAESHLSYQKMDGFMRELNNVRERLKTNVPTMITLTRAYSNYGSDKIFSTFAPRTAALEGAPHYVNAYTRDVVGLYSRGGDIAFNDIIRDYIVAEHERLVGKTIKQSIAEFEAKSIDVKEVQNGNYDELRLPKMSVTFTRPTRSQARGFSDEPKPDIVPEISSAFVSGEAHLALAFVKLHPEFAAQIQEECKNRLNDFIDQVKKWPAVYSYNENGPTDQHPTWDGYRDKTIEELNEIIEGCEIVIQHSKTEKDLSDLNKPIEFVKGIKKIFEENLELDRIPELDTAIEKVENSEFGSKEQILALKEFAEIHSTQVLAEPMVDFTEILIDVADLQIANGNEEFKDIKNELVSLNKNIEKMQELESDLNLDENNLSFDEEILTQGGDD